jgi:hypothetical protein
VYFPHVAVVDANSLQDLDGVGSYNIRAALPSPYINVLCANVEKAEIHDLVYESAINSTLNATADLALGYTYLFNWTTFATLQTPLDDVFGWTPDIRPPIFYKYPHAFNTVRILLSICSQKLC